MQDSKKKIIKDWIRRICFFITLFACLKAASYFFDPVRRDMPGQESEDLRYRDYYMQQEEEVDILVLGDSESITLLSPADLWTDYGYTCFLAGQPGQNIPETYYVLKDMLKTKHPKMVVLETHGCVNGGEDLAVAVATRSFAEYIFPILENHNLWKPMVTGERQGFNVNFNGYEVRASIQGWDGGPSTCLPEDQVVAHISRLYIKKLKKLCDDNDIKLVFVSAPSVRNYTETSIANIKTAAEEEGIDYIDLNYNPDFTVIDWSNDTMDGGDHINYYGTKKVTEFMAPVFSGYGIIDRRGEKQYEKWNEQIEDFNNSIPR